QGAVERPRSHYLELTETASCANAADSDREHAAAPLRVAARHGENTNRVAGEDQAVIDHGRGYCSVPVQTAAARDGQRASGQCAIDGRRAGSCVIAVDCERAGRVKADGALVREGTGRGESRAAVKNQAASGRVRGQAGQDRYLAVVY